MELLVFTIGLMLICLTHSLLVCILRKFYSYKGDAVRFFPNRYYQTMEYVFIMVNMAYCGLTPAIFYSESMHSDKIVVVAILGIVFGSLSSLLDINKGDSFFFFTEDYIKWNLTFRNTVSETKKVFLSDIETVYKKEGVYYIHFGHDSYLKIKMSNLKLLNNYKLLISKLDGLCKKELATLL